MQTVICLGPKACDIGELFEKDSDFQVKLIDKEIEGDNCLGLEKQKTPEDYEKSVPDMSGFFKDAHDEILFITTGECDVLSCSLKILQQIKDKNITIIYLRPNADFLGRQGTLQDKMAFNIFQEYTRSGLFKKLFIINEENIEQHLLNEMPITEIYEAYLKMIHNFVLNLNFIESEPLINHFSPPKDISRICTFAFYDLHTNSEVSMYNFNLIDDKVYHFFLTEDTLKTNTKIMREIKDKLKNKVLDGMKVSYTIYSTSGDTDYCFVVYYSKAIQP
jgi:hypothetical protein